MYTHTLYSPQQFYNSCIPKPAYPVKYRANYCAIPPQLACDLDRDRNRDRDLDRGAEGGCDGEWMHGKLCLIDPH